MCASLCASRPGIVAAMSTLGGCANVCSAVGERSEREADLLAARAKAAGAFS
jgi:hypothetical protein